MKRNLFLILALAAGFLFGSHRVASADDGRPGFVTWSDGRKMTGALSLSPGKNLLLFTGTGQVTVKLDQAKEIRLTPEKEETREGFYFPTAGQATKAKTGDVYPVRYLKTEITLADGQKLEGHLYTTVLYVETDEATEKVVLQAKQTGEDGQKISDIPYPALVQFAGGTTSTSASRIDLTQTHLTNPQPPVIVSRPDLALVPVQQVAGQQAWTVPLGDNLLFSVQAGDGFHVAWPAADVPPDIQTAVNTGLNVMQDFYDTKKLLGSFSDGDAGNVYSLVLMNRQATTYGVDAGIIPWGLVMVRWKYDPDQKKVTLLNRITLGMGQAHGNSQLPTVFKDADLLKAISTQPATPGTPP